MSPDNVFAAQMWGWPDAIIKRDAHGAVMFVNATFLSLYGGSIEDWQGMAVTGWSAPPAPGQAQRFETRIPGPDAAETVYDWLEAAGSDGSALAIARDVTPLLPSPGDAIQPDHTQHMPPPAEQLSAVAASSFESVMQDTLRQDATGQQISAIAADVHETPIYEPPVAHSASAHPASDHETSDHAPALDAIQPHAEASTAASGQAATESAPQSYEAAPIIDNTDFMPPVELSAPVTAEPAQPAASLPVAEIPTEAAPEPRVERREFERRALPIEDESAVLGNNWRDAVIAKAVGATEPVAEPTDTQSQTPDPSSIRKTADVIRILLAEDNAINALLTRTLLEAEGCHVDTVEDGQLAVEAMKVNAYDLIFMDMRMPNMDGLEATRKIRQMDHASKGLPIVALTANAFDDDRNACFDAGMNDFMTKPVSAEELSEMVAQWTGEEAEEKMAS